MGPSFAHPEPQLAAAMVAAFGYNSSKYKVKCQTMYGIIIRGTRSTFYKCDMDSKIYSSIIMGEKQDDAIMNMIRFSMARYDSWYCIVESKDKMVDTLRCYEAMRIVIAQEMEKCEKTPHMNQHLHRIQLS
jgi:hypothetical protein